MKEYFAIDVETSGLSPSNGDRVIECAAVKIHKYQGSRIGIENQLYISKYQLELPQKEDLQ